MENILLRFEIVVNISEVWVMPYWEAGPTARRCSNVGEDGARMTSTEVDESVRAEIIATVRAFVRRDVLPVVGELERTDTFPAEIVAQMRELGLFGITIPEAFGGLGLDLRTYIGVIEELAYGWMSLTGIVNTHTMAATLLLADGSRRAEGAPAPAMATGERRGALSLSEPDAGSDTRRISCKAVRDGEEYVVNGTKAWVTNGERASVVALAARTEEGISAFVVEKEPGPSFEGITVSKHVGKLGYRGVETVEMSYVDHRIPAANLHRRGRARPAPDPRRARGGAHQHRGARVGVARAAFDAALAYAAQRETFGKPIGEHQAIQLKLADMATKLQAARLLTEHAAQRKTSGETYAIEAGMAKLFASETALELSTEAMRILWGVGYTTEFPVERYYRDGAAHGDRRGHQRDPATRDRPGPPRRGRKRPAAKREGPRRSSSASTSSVCSPSRGAAVLPGVASRQRSPAH